jgi:predicted permease
MRLLLAESAMLSCAGCLAGIWLAAWVKSALLAFLPAASGLEAGLEIPAFLFAAVTSVACTVGVGLLPAWQAGRLVPAPALKGNSATGRTAAFGSRDALVVLQVALAVVLVTGSGLFLRTLSNLRRLDKGFDAGHLLVASVAPRLNGYTPERALRFLYDLTDRLQALPGVQSVAAAEITVVSGRSTGTDIRIEGYEPVPGESMNVRFNYVVGDYFSLMRIPIVAGRGFLPAEMSPDARVVVINETMARHFFPGSNPIGRRLAWRSRTPDTEIVGIVKDSKYTNLRAASPRLVYAPMVSPFEPAIHIRTAGDPATVAQQLRHEVAALDPQLVVFGVSTLEEKVESSIGQERLATALSGVSGILALFLSGLGLYGVIAFSVGRRTREIGIRMALGAQRDTVALLVLRQLFGLVAIGLIAGVAASIGLTRFVSSLLYGVTPGDKVAEGVAVLLTVIIAAFAGALPAYRAMRVDPLAALRHD